MQVTKGEKGGRWNDVDAVGFSDRLGSGDGTAELNTNEVDAVGFSEMMCCGDGTAERKIFGLGGGHASTRRNVAAAAGPSFDAAGGNVVTVGMGLVWGM